MPTLELVSLQDAQLELSLSGKGGAIMRQYMDYISHLETGRAGKLTPGVGETTAWVRRRLGAAAQLLGKNLSVKRQGPWSSSGKRTSLPRLAAARGAVPGLRVSRRRHVGPLRSISRRPRDRWGWTSIRSGYVMAGTDTSDCRC